MRGTRHLVGAHEGLENREGLKGGKRKGGGKVYVLVCGSFFGQEEEINKLKKIKYKRKGGARAKGKG